MTIDFKNGLLISKTVEFIGSTKDGREIIVSGNWNNFDDWNITREDIQLINGTDEEYHEIIKEFNNKMNK